MIREIIPLTRLTVSKPMVHADITSVDVYRRNLWFMKLFYR